MQLGIIAVILVALITIISWFPGAPGKGITGFTGLKKIEKYLRGKSDSGGDYYRPGSQVRFAPSRKERIYDPVTGKTLGDRIGTL